MGKDIEDMVRESDSELLAEGLGLLSFQPTTAQVSLRIYFVSKVIPSPQIHWTIFFVHSILYFSFAKFSWQTIFCFIFWTPGLAAMELFHIGLLSWESHFLILCLNILFMISGEESSCRTPLGQNSFILSLFRSQM